MPQVPFDRRVDANEENSQAKMPEAAFLQRTQLDLQTSLLEAPSGQGAHDVGQYPNEWTSVYKRASGIERVKGELQFAIDADAVGPHDVCH